MLILLGGAPRAGKSIVARAFAKRTGIPVMSLDTLMMGLHFAVPEVAVDIEAEPQVIGQTMWPLNRALAEVTLVTHSDYLIEGDMLQPVQVASLHEQGGEEVRSCFLGYQSIDRQQKFADIRGRKGLSNNWLKDRTDEYVMEVIDFGIRYSREQAAQCAELGLKHVDCSKDFEASISTVVDYLAARL